MLISRIIYEWMNLNFVRGRNSEMDVIFLKGKVMCTINSFFFKKNLDRGENYPYRSIKLNSIVHTYPPYQEEHYPRARTSGRTK